MVEKQCQTGLRRYRTPREAQELIVEYQARGLTRQEFCKRNDVCLNTLARYLKRYGPPTASANGSQQWVAVDVAEPRGASGELAVILRGGRRIEVARGFDAGLLGDLVIALERIG